MSNRRKFLKNVSLATAAALTARLDARALAQQKFSDVQPVLPRRLRTGDTIALTAPAGAIFNEDYIERATKSFEGQGFRVKLGATLTQKFGYLAGTDEFRAKELMDLFEDPGVRAIVAMRGGWGCARLLNLLDFDRIGKNPKIISGFSDITTLLLAIYGKTGMITFHGPVGYSTLDGFTMENFLRIVKDGEALNMVQPKSDPLNVISAGQATGRLLGGNLAVLCSLMGTGYLPDLSESLLFLEETEEEPYQIDRMLTQLDIAGTIGRSKGIIFGKCVKCVAEEPEKSFTLEEVFQQKFGNLTIPAVTNFSFGHVREKFTFPVGAEATFDTATSSVQLNQFCVL